MTKKTITAEALRAKGYRTPWISDWTLESACDFIRNNDCVCSLVPNLTGHMVAVVECNGAEYRMFYRDMTDEEKAPYAEQIAANKAFWDRVEEKTSRRQIASMYRQHRRRHRR